jgi:hypothetical protein
VTWQNAHICKRHINLRSGNSYMHMIKPTRSPETGVNTGPCQRESPFDALLYPSMGLRADRQRAALLCVAHWVRGVWNRNNFHEAMARGSNWAFAIPTIPPYFMHILESPNSTSRVGPAGIFRKRPAWPQTRVDDACYPNLTSTMPEAGERA